ncbi:GntR family transcriptional regulator [Spongiactinospora sp. 9N601]|uniref:GntR family transcriptional regulator n=1 Tax=Spongiactinospora sp. 9N601 TaxID=3375149 RepID=UPI0037A3F6C3
MEASGPPRLSRRGPTRCSKSSRSAGHRFRSEPQASAVGSAGSSRSVATRVIARSHIAARIAAGEFTPGDRLPSELDLSNSYGVARMTIRRAMQELTERGLVCRVHGKGTFVQPPPSEEPTE